MKSVKSIEEEPVGSQIEVEPDNDANEGMDIQPEENIIENPIEEEHPDIDWFNKK